jgi:hypothetical protein
MPDVNKGYPREELEQILAGFNGLYIRYYSRFKDTDKKAHTKINRMIREFIEIERDKEIEEQIKQEDMFMEKQEEKTDTNGGKKK